MDLATQQAIGSEGIPSSFNATRTEGLASSKRIFEIADARASCTMDGVTSYLGL